MPYRVARDHAVAWMLAALPIPCGLIIAMLNERFTSKSWRFASGIPGGYSTWGGALIVLGLAMLSSLIVAHYYHSPRGTAAFIAACTGVALWWLMLGCAFIYTAIRDPLANPLGGVVWLWLGALHALWAWYERRHLV